MSGIFNLSTVNKILHSTIFITYRNNIYFEQVKNGYLQHLNPWEKLIFFFAACILSGMLLVMLGTSLANLIFGVEFSTSEEMYALTDPGQIRTQKMLNFFFHLGAFIMPSILFAKLMAMDPEDYLIRKSSISGRTIGLVVLLFLGIIIISEFLSFLNHSIDFRFVSEEFHQGIVEGQLRNEKLIYAYIGPTWKSFGLNIILLAIIPAIGEEFVFRGIIQQLLSKATQRVHVSIWVTAFLFAFIHFEYMDFLPRFILGAVFGYVVVLTGNIWYAILLHFLNNATSLTFAYFINKGSLDGNAAWLNFGVIHLIIALIFAGVSFYLLSKNSKWQEIKSLYLTNE